MASKFTYLTNKMISPYLMSADSVTKDKKGKKGKVIREFGLKRRFRLEKGQTVKLYLEDVLRVAANSKAFGFYLDTGRIINSSTCPSGPIFNSDELMNSAVGLEKPEELKQQFYASNTKSGVEIESSVEMVDLNVPKTVKKG